MANISSNFPDTTITIWSWLFPVTYLIHIAEEYWGGGGYSAYLLRLRGVHFSPTRFLLIQSLGVVLMVTGVILARRFGFTQMMLVIFGAIVLVNGLTHTVTSIRHGGYGPGLISCLVIWIPLGLITLFRFKGRISERRFWSGVAIGVGVNGIITVLTLRGGRII
jgi:uncharacterized membrane protein HdeD (DUF308 family)